jgi:hypothetical protein
MAAHGFAPPGVLFGRKGAGDRAHWFRCMSAECRYDLLKPTEWRLYVRWVKEAPPATVRRGGGLCSKAVFDAQ